MMALTLAALRSSVAAVTHAVAPWYDDVEAATYRHAAEPVLSYVPKVMDASPTIVSLEARRSYRAVLAKPVDGGTTDTRFGRNSKQMEQLRRQQTVFIGAVTSGNLGMPALLGITLNGNVVSGYLIVKRADSESAGPVTGVREGKRLILHAPLGADQEKVDLLLDYGPLLVRGALTRSGAPDQADTVQFRRAS